MMPTIVIMAVLKFVAMPAVSYALGYAIGYYVGVWRSRKGLGA